jgi:hypothetical protein
MKNKSIFFAIILFVSLFLYFNRDWIFPNHTISNQDTDTVHTVIVPSDRFPETAAHIKSAIEHGESSTCTINRKGADDNRKKSLKGIPTKPNLDRDEFPMAMCAEGGTGADIMYINPTDNRGAGSWVSNQLEKYPDGTKIQIVVK